MKRISIFLIFSCCVAAVSPVTGQSLESYISVPELPFVRVGPTEEVTSYWHLNGSILALVKRTDDRESRKFIYVIPSEVLDAAGVKLGTPYFEGKIVGRAYVGQSYLFSKHCSPNRFEATGIINFERTRIELGGRARRRDKSCVTKSDSFREILDVLRRLDVRKDF